MIDGRLALAGAPDLRSLPLDRAVSLAYYLLCEHRDAAGIARLDAELDMPLPGEIRQAAAAGTTGLELLREHAETDGAMFLRAMHGQARG